MNRVVLPDPTLDHAMLLDEAGIETGILGELRLKSAYSLIFSRDGEWLMPVAAAATLQPMLHGRPVALRGLGASTRAAHDPDWVQRLETELHLRNSPNIGAENLDLHLRLTGPGLRRMQRRYAPGDPADSVPLVDPQRLVWQMRPGYAQGLIGQEAAHLRRIGCRIVLEGFGMDHEILAAMERLQPEFVATDEAWFRRVSGEPAAVLLFVRLVERLKQRGARVLVAGIETPGQLRVALRAEADLLQGDHIAPPALAGTLIDTKPRQLSPLIQEREVVVSLFG